MTTDSGYVPPAAPWDTSPGARISLESEAYASDPHRTYAEMRRQFGSMVPVELSTGVPATLVIGYRVALRVLHDPERFPADPRAWEGNLPSSCPIRPMTEWRPNAIRSAGPDHDRYRSAIVGALNQVDLHRLQATVEQIAVPLINSFCQDGTCDLAHQYALPVIFGTLSEMLGCTPEITKRVGDGLAAMFDGVDAEKGNQALQAALLELVQEKRVSYGDDVTSWLIRHPVGLDDNEMMHQMVLLFAAGIEPSQNWILNALQRMMTNDQFSGEVLDGSLSTQTALDDVLFNDPPMANYCLSYPKQPVLIDGVWLPANQPVLISIAACNNDPEIRVSDAEANRSHLAFSVGPHACPARSAATTIVREAMDQLVDAIPEVRLAVAPHELVWRPGPFHRALVALPVRFPKTTPIDSRRPDQ